jgi:biotin carboxylase
MAISTLPKLGLLGLGQHWKDHNVLDRIQQQGMHAFEVATDSIDDIIAQCGNGQCDAVFVADASCQEKLCDSRLLLQQSRVPVILPSRESCALERKRVWSAWMCSNGFEKFLPQRQDGEFPCIIKFGNSQGGSDVHLVNSEAELANAPDDAVIQRYIPGKDEYAWYFLACKGQVRWYQCYVHRFAEDYEEIPHIKSSIKQCLPLATDRCEIADADVAALKQLVAAMNFTGIGFFQMKFSRQKMFIIELNVRLGGSAVFSNEPCLASFLEDYIRCWHELQNVEHFE